MSLMFLFVTVLVVIMRLPEKTSVFNELKKYENDLKVKGENVNSSKLL